MTIWRSCKARSKAGERSRNQWLPFVICVILLADPAAARQFVGRRPVPAFAVSEVLLPVSAPTLRTAILKGLTATEERNDPVYQASGFVSRNASGHEAWVPALVEESTKPQFGSAYFRDPDHVKDLYVHFMGMAIVSSYFCANGSALDYKVTFSIVLEAIDESKTKVLIRTLKSEVFVGKELNLHAMGFVPKAQVVPESPLDQYKLLVYVAHLAGVQLTPLEAGKTAGASDSGQCR